MILCHTLQLLYQKGLTKALSYSIDLKVFFHAIRQKHLILLPDGSGKSREDTFNLCLGNGDLLLVLCLVGLIIPKGIKLRGKLCDLGIDGIPLLVKLIKNQKITEK